MAFAGVGLAFMLILGLAAGDAAAAAGVLAAAGDTRVAADDEALLSHRRHRRAFDLDAFAHSIACRHP